MPLEFSVVSNRCCPSTLFVICNYPISKIAGLEMHSKQVLPKVIWEQRVAAPHSTVFYIYCSRAQGPK